MSPLRPTSICPALAHTAPERLLIIQPGALGDSILSLTLAQQLAKCFPQATIEMLGHLDYISIFPGCSAVTAAADIDTAPLHHLFADPHSPLPPTLADYLSRFDAALTWLGHADSPFLANLSAAIDGPALFIDRGPPPTYPHHVVHYWLSQLFTILPAEDDWIYRLILSDRQIVPATKQLSQRLGWPIDQTAYLVFHPGAGSVKKCWPSECFAQLASRFSQDTDYRIVYLLGPAEQERLSPDTLADLNSTGQVLTALDLETTSVLISRARAFLGHDSGPTHLAAALSIPTLAIFGPTNPTHWRPLGANVKVIHSGSAGELAPSLEAITPAHLYNALQDVLDGDRGS